VSFFISCKGQNAIHNSEHAIQIACKANLITSLNHLTIWSSHQTLFQLDEITINQVPYCKEMGKTKGHGQ
jgi:hypothetical protein